MFVVFVTMLCTPLFGMFHCCSVVVHAVTRRVFIVHTYGTRDKFVHLYLNNPVQHHFLFSFTFFFLFKCTYRDAIIPREHNTAFLTSFCISEPSIPRGVVTLSHSLSLSLLPRQERVCELLSLLPIFFFFYYYCSTGDHWQRLSSRRSFFLNF